MIRTIKKIITKICDPFLCVTNSDLANLTFVQRNINVFAKLSRW